MPEITREEIAARLLAKMEPCPTTGCWLWMGTVDKGNGYGKMGHSGKTQLVHREAYKVWNGHLEDELSVDHTCRVLLCINPLHLEKCSRSENSRRERSRRMFCRKGLHLMTGPNVMIMKVGTNAGLRRCRACVTAYKAEWDAMNIEAVKAIRRRTKQKYGAKYRANERAKKLAKAATSLPSPPSKTTP